MFWERKYKIELLKGSRKVANVSTVPSTHAFNFLSFLHHCSAPRIATSGQSGPAQISEHAQSIRFVFSANQICRKVLESRFLMLTKRSAASENENVFFFTNLEHTVSARVPLG